MIPDYLVFDELKHREERRREGELQPLHLPLYQPEMDEWRDRPEEDDHESESEAPKRGVIIIDMNTGLELD